MKSVLIICRNHLAKAPRFLMQVEALSSNYNIVAAGLSYNDNITHTFIKIENKKFNLKKIDFHLKFHYLFKKCFSLFIKIYLNLFSRKENIISKLEFEELKKYHVDIVIVHHLYDVPLGFELAKFNNVKLIFNAHEYYPLEFDDNPDWMKMNHKKLVYLAKKYAKKIDLCFCVGDVISKKYNEEFGIKCLTINNSKPFKNLNPQPIHNDKIKLVHHGAAIRSRKIELMISTMDFLGDNYSLDLVLVGSDIGYLDYLKKLINKNKKIKLLDAVPTPQIPEFLNNYDIGIYILPPTNFNNKFALPNKFFEFIQARLALAIAPSPEMDALVSKYNLGLISIDFSPINLAKAIESVTADKIMYFKNQSDKYAKELSVEKNYELIRNAVKELIN